MLILVGVFNFNTEVALAPRVQAQYSAPIPTPQPVATTTDPVLSNCYAYVRSQIPGLPLQSELIPNSSVFVGAVAIFEYISKETGEKLDHDAIVVSFDAEGFWVRDANFGGPGIRTHFIKWGDPHFKGFFKVK